MLYISSGILPYLHANLNLIIDSENLTGKIMLFKEGYFSKNFFNKVNSHKIAFLLFPNPCWGLGNVQG